MMFTQVDLSETHVDIVAEEVVAGAVERAMRVVLTDRESGGTVTLYLRLETARALGEALRPEEN